MSSTIQVEAARIPDRDQLAPGAAGSTASRPRRSTSSRSSSSARRRDGEVFATVESTDHADRRPLRADEARRRDLHPPARRLDRHASSASRFPYRVWPRRGVGTRRRRARLALADADAERREAVAAPAAASSCSSETTSRAPLMPSGWPSAIAPPFTFTFSRSRPSSRIDGEALRRERLVELDEVELADTSTPVRSSSLRTAGIGPMPITRGSTPATALPTNAPSGSTPSSRAFSSRRDHERRGAVVDARDAFPAVTVPPSRNAGFSAASFSALVSGRGCSSRVDVADRRRARRRNARPLPPPPSAAATRARTRPDPRARRPSFGDVLARLAHRLEREHLLHARIREAPAERRVVIVWLPRGNACPASRDKRRARHRLDATRDEQVAVARDHA